MTGSGERLVVLADDAAGEALVQLRSLGRVSQIASPRVLVVEGGADPSAFSSIPGVVMATASELPAAVLAGLDEGEALFAQAWSSRVRQGPKLRTGEGLSWDAPGFLPPDPPPGPPRSEGTGTSR